MIVLIHAPTKQFFWKWAYEVDTYYAERGQEYMTVRVSEAQCGNRERRHGSKGI
jgi:hypothetical protein